MDDSDNRPKPEASLSSRAQRFRVRAEECWQLADIAKFAESKRIYRDLALSYDRLANRAETTSDRSNFRRVNH